MVLPTLFAALKLPNRLLSNKVCLLRIIDTATGAYEVRGRGGGDAVVDAKAASASYLLSVSGACLAAARVDGNRLVTPTQDAAPTYSEQQLLLHLRVRGQPCAVPDALPAPQASLQTRPRARFELDYEAGAMVEG